MFKEFLFVALFVFVVWVLIFQILIPYLQGMPFFPIFRSKEIRELEEEIAIVKQDIAAGEMKSALAKMKPQANNAVSSVSSGESL